MALYALGDMHLSFQVDKPMDAFGRVWKKHEEKIEKNCRKLIRPEDTFVITGDHSWGRKLSECEEDLDFIRNLPGEKILLRGNHDMFSDEKVHWTFSLDTQVWDAKKTAKLNAEFEPELHFLQNNFYTYKDYALVGTKGYTFEGPFWVDRRGQILSWDEEQEAQAAKLVKREAERLEVSFRAAKTAGYRKFILFLHYPPTSVLEESSIFTEMAEDYGAEHVVYSHCHGESRFADSIRGTYHGIQYHLVSGDYLNFRPEKILEQVLILCKEEVPCG